MTCVGIPAAVELGHGAMRRTGLDPAPELKRKKVWREARKGGHACKGKLAAGEGCRSALTWMPPRFAQRTPGGLQPWAAAFVKCVIMSQWGDRWQKELTKILVMLCLARNKFYVFIKPSLSGQVSYIWVKLILLMQMKIRTYWSIIPGLCLSVPSVPPSPTLSFPPPRRTWAQVPVTSGATVTAVVLERHQVRDAHWGWFHVPSVGLFASAWGWTPGQGGSPVQFPIMVTGQHGHILYKLCFIWVKLHFGINHKKNLGKDAEGKFSFPLVVMSMVFTFKELIWWWFGVEDVFRWCREGGKYSSEKLLSFLLTSTHIKDDILRTFLPREEFKEVKIMLLYMKEPWVYFFN